MDPVTAPDEPTVEPEGTGAGAGGAGPMIPKEPEIH
jgi:hypothetical protein